MKALTIWQPWAGLIIAGLKPIENRSWGPKCIQIGERFCIHAGKDQEEVSQFVMDEVTKIALKGVWHNGAILGTVVFDGVVKDPEQLSDNERKWFSGPMAWRLKDPVMFKVPIRCKGAIGLWELPAPVLSVLE